MIKTLQHRIRFPRLGRIKLGVMTQNASGATFPREVPYFVLPQDLRAKLGEQPTKLGVMFPADDPERVLSMFYERRSGKILASKCDGEKCIAITREGGELVTDCPKEARKPCPEGCQAKGHLNVIVLKAPLGVYQVTLGGEQRLTDLWTELYLYRDTFGRLTNIVFELERVPTTVQVPTDKGTMAKEGWPVHIRVAVAAEQAFAVSGVKVGELPGGQILPSAQPALSAAEAAHENVAPDEEAGELRTDCLWVLFYDAAGQEPTKALNLFRLTAKKHLGRPVASLDQLTDAELATLSAVMQRGR